MEVGGPNRERAKNGRPADARLDRCVAGPAGGFWREAAVTVLFGAAVAAIALAAWLPGRCSGESLQRAMVARDLVEGLSRGRQGLVGSVAFAPLPTVGVALLSVVPALRSACAAGPVLAGLATLLLCLYVNRLWAREGVSPWARYPAVGAMLLLPVVATTVASGRSTMVFVALAVGGWGFLTSWLRGSQLRDLAYGALLLGLSALVRYQGLLLVAGGFLFVMVAVLAQRRGLALAEGAAIIFLTPCLYLALLWIGGNWLILGDPVFFVRGVAHAIRLGATDARGVLTAQCEWMAVGSVGALVLSVPLAGLLVGRARGGGAARCLAALAGVAGAAALGLWAERATEPFGGDERVPGVVVTLEREHPNGSFIVTGYEGYEFVQAAGKDPDGRWIHRMHLESTELGRILRDFRGREVYVLVDTERTTEGWQQLGLEWQIPGSRVPEGFLYVEKLGPWAVFECIRAEEGLPGDAPGGPGRG